MKKKVILALMSMFIFFTMCGFREDEEKVYDDAGLFTEEEIEDLNEKCLEFAEATQLDIIVVTTADLGSKSSFEYTADFYIEGEFGYEEDISGPSGIVFFISVDPYCREIYILTAGIAQIYLDDSGEDNDIDDIIDAGYYDCKSGLYYKAMMAMLDRGQSLVERYELAPDTEEVIEAWYEGDYEKSEDFIEDYEYHSYRTMKSFMAIGVCFLIGLAVSGIFVGIMNRKYKNKMIANGGTYFEKNSFVMKSNYDNFVRTDVTRVRIESSSGGGGGGGGGSRGGRSFGGGGRRF